MCWVWIQSEFFLCLWAKLLVAVNHRYVTDSLVLPTCSLSISSSPRPSWWPLLDHAPVYPHLSCTGDPKTGYGTLDMLAQCWPEGKDHLSQCWLRGCWCSLLRGLTSLPQGTLLMMPGCNCSIWYHCVYLLLSQVYIIYFIIRLSSTVI